MSIPAMSGGEALGNPSRPLRLLAAGALIGAALASIPKVDAAWDRLKHPSTETELGYVFDDDVREDAISPDKTKIRGVVGSGLGSNDGEAQAGHMRRVVGGNMAYIRYSSDKVCVDGIAQVLRKDEGEFEEEIDLIGHSMGTLVLLEAFARADIDIKLRNIFMIGSPNRTANVHNWRLALMTQKAGLVNGPASKFMGSYIRTKFQDGLFSPALEQAKRDSRGGCSGRQWASMLDLLVVLEECREQRAESWAPLMSPNTRAYYCLPEIPSKDTTVNTVQAADDFEADLGNLQLPFKVPLRRVRVPMGHAGVKESADVLERLFEREQQAMRLPPDYPMAA